MPVTPGSDIQYLKKLKPDENLETWLRGFNNNGIWDKKLCKEFFHHKILIEEHQKSTKSNKRKRNVKNSKSITNVIDKKKIKRKNTYTAFKRKELN